MEEGRDLTPEALELYFQQSMEQFNVGRVVLEFIPGGIGGTAYAANGIYDISTGEKTIIGFVAETGIAYVAGKGGVLVIKGVGKGIQWVCHKGGDFIEKGFNKIVQKGNNKKSSNLLEWKGDKVSSRLEINYNTEYAPFSMRIDPITGKGPMHVDSKLFTSATSYTREGSARNAKQFWKLWTEKYPNTMSMENISLINNKSHFISPKVDEQWIKHFPEHRTHQNDTLVHHHIDYGNTITALPDKLHRTNPGRQIFHTNPEGKVKIE